MMDRETWAKVLLIAVNANPNEGNIQLASATLAEAERDGMMRAAEIAEERAEWVPLRPGDMRKAILCATAAPTP